MHSILPDGKTSKEDLVRRLDRADLILNKHRNPPRPLQYRCANHLADALGSTARCLMGSADRALDAAEQAAAETEPDTTRRPRTYTLQDLEAIVRDQRASLPTGAGRRGDGWPP